MNPHYEGSVCEILCRKNHGISKVTGHHLGIPEPCEKYTESKTPLIKGGSNESHGWYFFSQFLKVALSGFHGDVP